MHIKDLQSRMIPWWLSLSLPTNHHYIVVELEMLWNLNIWEILLVVFFFKLSLRNYPKPHIWWWLRRYPRPDPHLLILLWSSLSS